MATAAAYHVQSVTELLEMILYELPPIDILVYQRVCPRWKSVITRSKQLQKALFFEPVSHDILRPHFDDFTLQSIDAAGASWYSTSESSSRPSPQRVFLNPMVAHLFDTVTSGRDDKWTSPDASWRRMLLTQPPSKMTFTVAPGLHCFNFYYHHLDDARDTLRSGLTVRFRKLSGGTKQFNGYVETVEAKRKILGLNILQGNYQLDMLPCDK